MVRCFKCTEPLKKKFVIDHLLECKYYKCNNCDEFFPEEILNDHKGYII